MISVQSCTDCFKRSKWNLNVALGEKKANKNFNLVYFDLNVINFGMMRYFHQCCNLFLSDQYTYSTTFVGIAMRQNYNMLIKKIKVHRQLKSILINLKMYLYRSKNILHT